LKGTQNVLKAAAKSKDTLKRVILTSSVAGIPHPNVAASVTNAVHCERCRLMPKMLVAVHGEYAVPPKNGVLYSEEDWNETSSIDNGQAYHLSKVEWLQFMTGAGIAMSMLSQTCYPVCNCSSILLISSNKTYTMMLRRLLLRRKPGSLQRSTNWILLPSFQTLFSDLSFQRVLMGHQWDISRLDGCNCMAPLQKLHTCCTVHQHQFLYLHHTDKGRWYGVFHLGQ
jgi:hypothetical protein